MNKKKYLANGIGNETYYQCATVDYSSCYSWNKNKHHLYISLKCSCFYSLLKRILILLADGTLSPKCLS